MVVGRKNDELVIRFSLGENSSRIQSILDYLRYEELTSKSTATEKDVDDLVNKIKKGRWSRSKKTLGFED